MIMKYDIDFAIAALVFLILFYLSLKLMFDNRQNSVIQLKRLIIFIFCADILDIITVFTISYAEVVPLWVNYLVNILFYEFIIIGLSYLPRYVRFIVDPENGRKNLLDYANDVIMVVYAIICASTFVTHAAFYFDENFNYSKGSLYYLIYAMQMYFIVYAFVRVVINKKILAKRQFYSIIGFIVCAIMGPIIQLIWLNDYLFSYFTYCLASYVLIYGLETPDYQKLKEALSQLEENKKLLEISMKREEERNKAVHAMTKTASWSLSFGNDGEVTDAFWSDEFFWMLGYEKKDIDMKKTNLWSESLHPDDAEEIVDAFTKGMKGIAPYNVIYRMRNRQGEYRWYRGTGELVYDSVSDGMVYQGIIQDIDEEKIREDLAREKIEALEQLEKSQQALKEAVVRAESADRAKSDFLANMSHEIRTPINAVLGMNELIGRESTEENIQNYSANVDEAGQALLSLINDILDFSKIEAGRMELAPMDYDMNSLIGEVKNMIGVRCADRNLKFVVKVNPDTPRYLYGDEVRIRQVLINILNNAVKYTDEGTVTFSVDYKNIADGQTTLVMSAHDTGIGIKEENIAELFDSFKRIDPEHNRKREGTGLGLSITKSFVEMMGGSIEVSSVYGEGSTFTVCIPQKITGEGCIGDFGESVNSKKKNKYEASFTAPEAKILVVDDVKMNLKVIAGLLKQTLINIVMVDSGMACIDAVKNEKYDVVFLDHMMPGMDGIETMHVLNEDKEHPNQDTPIIMLTANAIIGAKEEYLDAGFSDYLSKPVKAEELEEMLIKYLPANKVNKTER